MIQYYSTLAAIVTTSTAIAYQTLQVKKESIKLLNTILERMDYHSRLILTLQEDLARTKMEVKEHLNG
jgi:hypothetical protein